MRMLRKRVSMPNRTITRRVFQSSEREQPTRMRRMLLMIATNAIIMINVVWMTPGEEECDAGDDN